MYLASSGQNTGFCPNTNVPVHVRSNVADEDKFGGGTHSGVRYRLQMRKKHAVHRTADKM